MRIKNIVAIIFCVIVVVFSVVCVHLFMFNRNTQSTGIAVRMSTDIRNVFLILCGLNVNEAPGNDEWMMWPRKNQTNECQTSTIFFEKLYSILEGLGVPERNDIVFGAKKDTFLLNGVSRWQILLDVDANTPDFVPLIMSNEIDATVLAGGVTFCL